MNRLMVNALNVGIAAALAMGLAACNRSADAGTSSVAATASVAAPNAAVATGAAGDSAAGSDNGVSYARVVSVDPVRANDTGRVCHDETVTQTAPPKDQHQVAGTVIGAVAGGLLGHMVGGGRGNTLTTVAGAAGGGYVGNRIEASHQQGQVTSSVQRTCSTVSNPGGKIIGYDVRYVYNGVTRTARMDHDPGDRVQVQQGVVAVSDAR